MSAQQYFDPAQSSADSQPLAGASFGQAFNRYYQKYATFKGRASRSEYWWVQLYLAIVAIILYIPVIPFAVSSSRDTLGVTNLDTSAVEMSPIANIALIVLLVFAVIHLVPNLALLARRLHDANFSGWLMLLGLIPLGGIVIFIFTLLPSKAEGARFD